MSENSFERHIQSKLQPAEIAPREELWSMIEARIAPKRRHPLFGFWWFGGLVGLLALAGWGLLRVDLGDTPNTRTMSASITTPSAESGKLPQIASLQPTSSAHQQANTSAPRQNKPQALASSHKPASTYISQVLPASAYVGGFTPLPTVLKQKRIKRVAKPTSEPVLQAVTPLQSLATSAYNLSIAYSQLDLAPNNTSYHKRSWWIGLQATQAQLGRSFSETFQSAPLISSQIDKSLGESRFVLPEDPTFSQTLTFPKTSQSIHVSLLHQFNSYLGLQLGIGYQSASGGIFTVQEVPTDLRPQGALPISQSNLNIIQSATFSEKSIEIPVALRTSVPIGRAALVLTTGAALNLAQQRQIGLPEAQLETEPAQPQLSARYSHADASLALQWHMAPNLKAEVGPSVSYYLSNAYRQVTAAPRYRAGLQVGVWYRIP